MICNPDLVRSVVPEASMAAAGATGIAGEGGSDGTRRLFTLLLLCLLLFSIEGLSRIAERYMAKYRGVSSRSLPDLLPQQVTLLQTLAAGRSRMIDFHPRYGWCVKASARTRGYILANDRACYTTNELAVRSLRPYSSRPDPGTLRLAAFGDSFTFGDGVDDADTWTAGLEWLLTGIEVLNFGVGGFGPDQALLRYRDEGRNVDPDIVIIGFMSENILRIVNRFRPFYSPHTGIPLTKPRFILENKTLHLLENPLHTRTDLRSLANNPGSCHRFRSRDHWFIRSGYPSQWDVLAAVRLIRAAAYRHTRSQRTAAIIDPNEHRYRTGTEAFQLLVKLFETFCSEVRAAGSKPVILLFPLQYDLTRFLKTGDRVYDPLINQLRKRNLPFIDGLDLLAPYCLDHPVETLFTGAHYSPLGNRRIAAGIATRIPDLLTSPAAEENRSGEQNQR